MCAPLSVVCGIVAGINFLMTSFTAALLKARRNRGIVLGETEEIVLDKPTQLNAPIISNLFLALTACIFMCGRTTVELFLLPYVLHAVPLSSVTVWSPISHPSR